MLSAIARLFSANLLIQFIPFLTAPLLAYLYDLDKFGVFSTIVSIAALLGCFASGKLDRALIVASTDRAASVVAATSFSLTLLFSLFVTVLLCAGTFFVDIDQLYFFIPLFLFLSNSNQVFMANTNRHKKYRLMVKVRLSGALCRAVFMLGFGFIDPTVMSLLLGYLLGLLCESVILSRTVGNFFTSKTRFSWSIKRYQRFLRITTFSSFLESLTSVGLPALFSIAFGDKEAGAVAMAQRLLAKPVGALGGAVSEVFKVAFQKDATTFEAKMKLYRKFLLMLSMISIPPFAFAATWGESVVLLLLGAKWGLAADYIVLLLPVYLLSFDVGSISSILFAFDNLGSDFTIQTLVSVGTVLTLTVIPMFEEFKWMVLYVFVIVLSAKYLAMLLVIELEFSKKSKEVKHA